MLEGDSILVVVAACSDITGILSLECGESSWLLS
jgi:hypothetical protein